MTKFKIGSRLVGPGHDTYVIAEMSGNHGGIFERAIEIIRLAKDSGADAVKLQTYTADTITLNCSKPDFQLPKGPWESYPNLYSLYKNAYTPWEWHKDLFKYARKIGIEIFSSPFDASAVELLESLDTAVYKIASPEITDIPLLKTVAETKKPVILSTGVANLEDIQLAVESLEKFGCKHYAILKCTTAYPTPFSEVNLKTMSDLRDRFNCPVGISDHSIGNVVPILSIGLGANLIEKHITLDEKETVDSFFSSSGANFKELVRNIREAEQSLGKISYELSSEAQKSYGGRRSLYVCRNISKGEKLTTENVRSVRPAYGLHPKYLFEILGKKVKRDLELGDRLSLEDIEI